MDSLTQVILGAAVGEAVLGKKIGGRAMIWGGFAGFLPDLDVTSSFVVDEISALAIHRGITHSFIFAAVFSVFIAWLVHKLYDTGLYQKKAYKIVAAIIAVGGLLFTANYLPYMVSDKLNMSLLWGSLGVGAIVLLLMNRYYFQVEQKVVKTTWREWYWLFFWAIITHPILDCFTTYGTQIFLPFSDYRVAFNVISVADPIYTVPFLITLIIAALQRRGTKWRSIVNWTGIIVSSLYMTFCFYHKLQVNKIFERSLSENNISYSRYMTSPLIFNNVLWLGLAESDTAYYHAYYSFMDEDTEMDDYNIFPKQHEILADYEGDPTLKTLRWFSNNYYTVLRRPDGDMQMNDVRFGIFGNKLRKSTDYVFKFILEEKKEGLEMHQSREGREINKETFRELWDRIWGKG
ncbi:MAG: inner membrane protein [Gammaproteobacteria bacterium]|jgi:inner membrane protein